MGGGKLRELWWRQAAAEQQLEDTLKHILPASGSGGNRNQTGVSGERKGRRSTYKAVMGERNDRDGFLLCWDGDWGRPGEQMILASSR